MNDKVCFKQIREDWYRANQLVPRLIRKTMKTGQPVCFSGFPRQWIPIFEYFSIQWENCIPPAEYVPIVSELGNEALQLLCRRARENGTLRELLESIVVLDPVLADFLYILDNTVGFQSGADSNARHNDVAVRLTNWQSYGRCDVQELLACVDGVKAQKPIAVVLPCSRKRPYGSSRTHHRMWRELESIGFKQSQVHQIVVTALAIVPEELWEHAVVLKYDAGVPDVYRLLRLGRAYFSRNRYER